MRNIWSLIKKELRAYFSSPIAYVVIAGFLLLVGYFFTSLISWFNAAAMQMAQNPYYAQQVNINEMVFSPLFHNMTIILVLVAPLLTMRLLAEEKKSGTDELLFTSPLSVGEIVLGKYAAALIMLTIMLGLTALLSVFAFAYGNPELAPWLTGYLGLFLTGALFIAIGLFFSSLTENQIVAAFLTVVALLLLLVLNWATSSGAGGWRSVVGYLSFSDHFGDMTRGILDTKDLVYYVTFSFFGLFLAHSVIQSRRWR
ncbi:MAG: ABC transporter permease subunit [Candidatus Aminicenantes bacterium]|nr:ABC transporter permease subunit [Candidatus Aminicenantes bacterium]